MKKNYYYTDKSQTPLSWHNWFKGLLIVGAVYSIGYIFLTLNNYNSLVKTDEISHLTSNISILFGIECVYNAAWAVLCITTFIGLKNFKSYGWYGFVTMLIARVIANIIIGSLWFPLITNNEEYFNPIYIDYFCNAIAFVIIGIPLYIYYNKRKPLFFSKMIQCISEDQKHKYIEIEYKNSEDLYKSDNLNRTIPLSDDEPNFRE